MERCDFCSVMRIMREYISDERGLDQSEILYQLFETFFRSSEGENLILDNGQVCRWLNGQAKLSPQIISYYLKLFRKRDLAADLEKNIHPLVFDMGMVVQKVYELVLYDTGISDQKKKVLCRHYPCDTPTEESKFLADVLAFSMERTFVKRDAQTKELLVQGRLSPIIRDYVLGGDIPKPCRWFCGRAEELKQLHTLLEENGKVFLYGIAGIGKSELAKAYAAEYKKSYTNTLYLTYSGDLVQDITDMDFVDDLPTDSEKERFRKHNQFLRSLKEDTLFVIDNFNTTETQDDFLSVILKYRCRILFTTRSKTAGRTSFLLEEISDSNALFGLFAHFYSDAERQRPIVEQIIDTVHAHTFAVELAARLLEHGILSAPALLDKLQIEKTGMDAADKIGVDKDGRRRKDTYYGHIHTLFSLYQLSESEQTIMRGLSLVPLSGIPARQFARWMELPNMNGINDLIEMGFIQEKAPRMIGLHPMMQEITVTDTKPSVTNCRTLLEHLQHLCLLHGRDIANCKILFQTIENAVLLLIRDDEVFFLRFVEDAIPYMEKYRYEPGIACLLKEIKLMLNSPSCGHDNDRALLLDYAAMYEDAFHDKTEKAIKLEKEALALLPEVTADNAHLAANLHANLGGLYKRIKKYPLARQHMEQGMDILTQYKLTHTNDTVIQAVNYAVLLGDMGQAEQGLTALENCAAIVKKYNSDQCLDYALVQEAIGCLHIVAGQTQLCGEPFSRALSIYQECYSEEPELYEEKKKEIISFLPQTIVTNEGIFQIKG